jgi:hypothetical protein
MRLRRGDLLAESSQFVSRNILEEFARTGVSFVTCFRHWCQVPRIQAHHLMIDLVQYHCSIVAVARERTKNNLIIEGPSGKQLGERT